MKDMGKGAHYFWLWACLWVLAACRPTPPPSPVPIAGASPTSHLPATVTPTAAIESTPAPTEKPAPSPSPLPTASPTPLPLLSSPCGTTLPLQPPNTPPTTTSLNPNQLLDDVPETARAAVRYILENPEDVGLVAFRVGQEPYGIYLNADTPMPLASVAKLIDLLAYAEAVNAGELDPTEWVPLRDLEQYYLPGTDLNAHTYALEDAGTRDLIAADPPRTPLEEVPWMMIQHSSNAAADYLHQRLGQARLEATAQERGLGSQGAPCPFIGQFLVMANHLRAGSDPDAIKQYAADLDAYGADVMRLTDAFALDPSFRAAEIAWRRSNRRPSVQTQRLFTESLGARASARDYANLMSRIAQNQLTTGYMNILVRHYLEWPMIFAVNQDVFWTMGYKGGSLPGVLTGVYYGEPLTYRVPVVVALFFHNLPMQTYRQWRQNWPHDELARWLMYDVEALPTLARLLNNDN